jgi:putative membrane protein
MSALLMTIFAAHGAGQGAVALVLAAGAHPLVHLNAALNLLATILLAVGLWQIKHRRESAHGRTMLAALAVSTAFLVSYLTYHFAVQLTVRFTHPGPVKVIYYAILLSHVLLAITVPFFALAAALFGARAVGWGGAAALSLDEKARFRAKHLRLVRWAYPIWMYVSITGVIVYAMLYHLWPSAEL